MRPGRAAACALLAALAVSCGSKPPAIAAVEWRLESRPSDRGPSYESLSVFGSIKDEDGLDNIMELWVVNDSAALAWKLTDADWIKASSEDAGWIGGAALATPELGAIPRGLYRLIAVDAAGQRAESSFTVSGGFPDLSAPIVSFAQGRLSLHSAWPETLVLAFDATGAFLASSAAPTGSETLSEAFGQAVADRSAFVGSYGYEPSLKMGAFSPRIKTR